MEAAAITALIVAIGGVAGAISIAWKTLTEARGMRIQQNALARRLADVHYQTVNDHESNMRVDLDDLRDMVQAVGEGVGRVEAGQKRHDAEIGRLSDSQVELGRSIGQVGERLAQADHEDRSNARAEHDRLWHAIRTIKETP